MCDPVSLGLAAATVSAAGAGLSFVGQNQASKQNERAANLTYASQYDASDRRRAQLDAQFSEDNVSSYIEAVAARGRIAASASAMGLDASTTARFANAADFEAGRGMSIAALNRETQRGDTRQSRVEAGLQRNDRIASKPRASALALGVDLAKAGLAGANMYSSAGGTF